MANKFYAVKAGLTPGIYNSWEECKAQVDGFSGAEYKSFKTKEEAEKYLSGDTAQDETPDFLSLPADKAVAYVDGSYRDDTKEFGYGAVIFHRGMKLRLSGKSADPSLVDMRNVAGEIKGSEAAMQYAANNGVKHLTIYHDYEGIAKWCTGEWKTNKPGTLAYKMFYAKIVCSVDVDFMKVKGHSGDTYNEMADKLAKQALGII